MALNKLAATVIAVSSVLAIGCSSSSDNNAAALAELDGTWLIACTDEGFGESSITMLTIAGSSFTVNNFEYDDTNCTVPASPAEVVVEGTLVYPGGTTTTALGDARHVDIMSDSILFDGVEPSAELIAANTKPSFGLLLVSEDRLYTDKDTDELDGSTPEKRPIEIDTIGFFVRQ